MFDIASKRSLLRCLTLVTSVHLLVVFEQFTSPGQVFYYFNCLVCLVLYQILDEKNAKNKKNNIFFSIDKL
jgi:hypothetical protein